MQPRIQDTVDEALADYFRVTHRHLVGLSAVEVVYIIVCTLGALIAEELPQEQQQQAVEDVHGILLQYLDPPPADVRPVLVH